MSLPRDDLDLIDALVWCGALSRVAARETAAGAEPGRVASYIWERGFCTLTGPSCVIVERLAKAEAAERVVAARVALTAGVENALTALVDRAIKDAGVCPDCGNDGHPRCATNPETD